MTGILLVFGGLFLLYCFVGGWVSYREGLIRPNQEDRNYLPERDDDRPISPRATEYRRRAIDGNRWWNAQPLERIEITSFDGLRLRGGYLPSDEDHHRLAIVVHGHLCCAGEEGFISEMFHRHGFDVLAVDQRAHGKSEGKLITMGQRESEDCLCWAQEMVRRYPDKEIVLYGASMGGATVCLTSEKELPEQVKCIISDCAYTSAREVFLVELKSNYSYLPLPKLLIAVGRIWSILRQGFDFYTVSVRDAIKHSKRPMLFIQGEADRLVLPSMGKELYEVHPGPKEYLSVPTAGHNVSYFHDTETYEKRCMDFIDRYF